MAKIWKKILIKEEASFSDRENVFNACTKKVSDPIKSGEEIILCIKKNDSESLEKLLIEDFFYPNRGEIYHQRYQGSFHSKHWEYQDFLVSPVVETLYFEHLDIFYQIVASLKHSDIALQEMFLKICYENNKIPDNIFTPLSDDSIQRLRNEILLLQLCSKKHHLMGKLIEELTSTLDLISDQKLTAIEQAEFKINFFKTIHSQDKILAIETNYKKIIVNCAMILLGFIPNIILFIATGNFLFFNKTAKQECIECMDKEFIDLQIKPENVVITEDFNLSPGDVIWPREHAVII